MDFLTHKISGAFKAGVINTTSEYGEIETTVTRVTMEQDITPKKVT